MASDGDNFECGQAISNSVRRALAGCSIDLCEKAEKNACAGREPSLQQTEFVGSSFQRYVPGRITLCKAYSAVALARRYNC